MQNLVLGCLVDLCENAKVRRDYSRFLLSVYELTRD